jgi:hypothetical protein
VSEAKHITRIAQRTVVSDNALSVLVPVLEEVVGWDAPRIRQLFAARGLVLQEWDKARTDWVTLRELTDERAARGRSSGGTGSDLAEAGRSVFTACGLPEDDRTLPRSN